MDIVDTQAGGDDRSQEALLLEARASAQSALEFARMLKLPDTFQINREMLQFLRDTEAQAEEIVRRQ